MSLEHIDSGSPAELQLDAAGRPPACCPLPVCLLWMLAKPRPLPPSLPARPLLTPASVKTPLATTHSCVE